MPSLSLPNCGARRLTLCLCLLPLAGAAAAGEVYLQAGLPGVGIGYAEPISSFFGLRGDYVTLGSRDKDTVEEGITYRGHVKTGRGGVYADWYPFAGSFRFSIGATANQFKVNLDASGAGTTINVGGTNYVLAANDGLAVEVKFPSTTPYAGFGWGHQASNGLRFSLDVGASIGKARFTVTPRGQLAQPSAQADVDRETAELRDGVGKVRAIPQLSVAFGYSF